MAAHGKRGHAEKGALQLRLHAHFNGMTPTFEPAFRFMNLLRLSVLLAASALTSLAAEPTRAEGYTLRPIGTGDARISLLNTVLLDPENGLDATLIQTSHDGHFIRDLTEAVQGTVVRFQPSTGETEYLKIDGSSGAWGAVVTDNGDLYVSGHMSGYLFHLPKGGDAFRTIAIPRDEDDVHEYLWSLDQGSDGALFIGTYPDCALLRYDPATEEFTHLGIMKEGENMARHINARFPGKIHVGIASHAYLIQYDMATGEKRELLPEAYQDRSFTYYSDRWDDRLFAVVVPRDRLLFFDPTSGELLREVEPPPGSNFWKHTYHAMIPHEGGLYFGVSPTDHLYRYDWESDSHTLVAENFGRPFGLAAGRYLWGMDYFGTYRAWDLVEERVALERPARFTGKGLQIQTLAERDDGTLVGSTYINQGFFTYDPASDELVSLGASVSFGGQIDELAPVGDKVYLAHYTKCRLSVYDPAQPWNPGVKPDANPRQLGRVGLEQNRFATVHHDSNDLIYLGTSPNYGQLGGVLAIYDPATDRFDNHRNIVPEQSVSALKSNADDTLLYGGTNAKGAIGANADKNAEAQLFIWDKAAQKIIFQITPVPGAKEVWDLSVLPNGQIVGCADETLFLFDPATREIVRRVTPFEGHLRALETNDGPWGYGNTEKELFRFSHDLRTIELIDERDGYWRALLLTSKGQLYAGIAGELYEVELP